MIGKAGWAGAGNKMDREEVYIRTNETAREVKGLGRQS